MTRKMKASGITWIGMVPSNWTCSKIKMVTKIKSGEYIPGEKYEENGEYEVVGSNGRMGYTNTYNNLEEVLTTGRVGTIGKVSIVGKSWITDNALILKANDKIHPKLLYYLLPNIDFDLISTGTAQPLITATALKNETIAFPLEKEKQQKIINFLDEKTLQIDSILTDTQDSIIELQDYKQSLISETVTSGLNKNVEFKKSGVKWINEIPKHWSVVSSKRLFAERKEKALPGERQLTASQKHGIIYQDEFMRLESQKVVTVEKGFSILKQVRPNDFVISMRSFQGGLEYSQFSGSISSAYVMLIPNEMVYVPYFRWLLKSTKYINAIRSTSNLVRDGQAMRYTNFAKVPLFIIPIEEQQRMAKFLDEKCTYIDSLIKQKQQLLVELDKYRKAFIYEYVTGKKEVL